MNEKQARELKVGDKIIWGGDRGEIIDIEMGDGGFKVAWEHALEGWIPYGNPTMLTRVEKVTP